MFPRPTKLIRTNTHNLPRRSLPDALVYLFAVGLDYLVYSDEATTASRHSCGAAEGTRRGGTLQGLEIRMRLPVCTHLVGCTFHLVFGEDERDV